MDEDGLKSIAMLLQARGEIEARIADIVGRPLVHGHLSDWIAAQIFDIELEAAAGHAVDGWFRSGPLAGRTVNIKHYTRAEGLLDLTDSDELEYYLVMTGPRAARPGVHRPWGIDHVYVFDAFELTQSLRAHMRRIGVATSVRPELWHAAEVYPRPANPAFKLTPTQTAALEGFSSAPATLGADAPGAADPASRTRIGRDVTPIVLQSRSQGPQGVVTNGASGR
ncbi:hypothetical protein [Glycomyces sp. YM15]|uniref:hypothetical protein n=1 Tax=Glycomyces sp. YM15 TaxID=2800446 RepID=UPI001962B910|nr:hypothetical protein [Glycomyces sp. YM15]